MHGTQRAGNSATCTLLRLDLHPMKSICDATQKPSAPPRLPVSVHAEVEIIVVVTQ